MQWRCWLAACLVFAVPDTASSRSPAQYRHAAPNTPRGALGLATKAWTEDVDPSVAAVAWPGRSALRVSAAPGESEPATFVVYARRKLSELGVRVTDLTGRSGHIVSSAVSVREVHHTRTRRTYFYGNATKVVGRFVPAHHPTPLPAREFREILLDVQVPPHAAAGIYTGRIIIGPPDDEVTRLLTLRVRPVELVDPTDKGLGIYYRLFAHVDDPDTVGREVADMRDHGVENLVTDLRPTFGRNNDGGVVVRTDHLTKGLDLLSDAGVRGTVVVDSGLVQLARIIGHEGVVFPRPDVRSLRGDGGREFREDALRVLHAIRRQARTHPHLKLAVAHVDEIFRVDRTELFEELAKAWPQVPEFRIFATMSTSSPEEDELRRRVDPFVDIRSNHGFTFEWWVARGGSFDGYAQELRKSGDRAWLYHNERGTWFDARWARLVNGLYLWASPFEVHAPWVYRKTDGDPFDDTDGTMHDFGVAFAGPKDTTTLIPTRNWFGVREGWDDLRYLATLEAAIKRHHASAPELAQQARRFLRDLAADVLRRPPSLDPDGLPAHRGTAREAPFLADLARRYDTAALDVIRERAEELTVSLHTSGRGTSR